MSLDQDEYLAAALRDYRRALREVHPSPDLDARIESAIAQRVQRQAWSRRRWRLAVWSAAAAAGIAAVAVTTIIMLMRPWSDAPTAESADVQQLTYVSAAEIADVAELPWYALDAPPWPVDTAIVRMRGSLATEAVYRPDGMRTRQFWVDVRLSSDGSARILRVVPIDEESY